MIRKGRNLNDEFKDVERISKRSLEVWLNKYDDVWSRYLQWHTLTAEP